MTDMNENQTTENTAKKWSWGKRILVASAAVVALGGTVGAVKAYSWHSMEKGERVEHMRGKAKERMTKHLDLTEAQQTEFEQLTQVFATQFQLNTGGMQAWPEQIKSVVGGPTFDRAAANQFLSERLSAIATAQPEIINAAADFYDSLNPEQQAQIRERLEKGMERGRHHR
ncbi:MAG: periplasmic heavy metal sensor [Gammaproteobacteria bacterium]|nr:periplasmic heavy metal sensor [Gammaproteobacteria bacterium]